MAFYANHILPRIIDRGMRNDFMFEHRDRAAPLASGRTLEIGMGSGLNFPFYTSKVQHFFGLEPSALLREKAQPLADGTVFPVELIDALAENIPLETNSIDSVVSSWTVCSISGVEQALAEVRRVLRPDGRFIFIEHGRAPDASVSKWQDRLLPVFRPLAGCSLNRAIDELIEAAGFKFATLEKDYFDGPRFISYHYVGQAQPN